MGELVVDVSVNWIVRGDMPLVVSAVNEAVSGVTVIVFVVDEVCHPFGG
jgi:hypothetical protein